MAAAKKAAKKATAKRVAVKKTAARKSAGYPFAFLGEGAAGYFEWGEILVCFVKPVPVKARAAVKRDIPEPFRGSVTWEGPILYAGNGDQWINFHITQAYPEEGDADEDDDEDEDGFGDLRDVYPSKAQEARFEREINAWLLRLHAKHPIGFVARREDGEAGGTRLGKWHRWSAQRFVERVLPLLEPFPGPADSTRAYANRVCLGLIEDSAPEVFAALPAKYRKGR